MASHTESHHWKIVLAAAAFAAAVTGCEQNAVGQPAPAQTPAGATAATPPAPQPSAPQAPAQTPKPEANVEANTWISYFKDSKAPETDAPYQEACAIIAAAEPKLASATMAKSSGRFGQWYLIQYEPPTSNMLDEMPAKPPAYVVDMASRAIMPSDMSNAATLLTQLFESALANSDTPNEATNRHAGIATKFVSAIVTHAIDFEEGPRDTPAGYTPPRVTRQKDSLQLDYCTVDLLSAVWQKHTLTIKNGRVSFQATKL